MTVKSRTGLEEYLQSRKKMVDEALERYLPREQSFPEVIFQAVRYSTLAGGKRIRPILCIAAAEAVGGNAEEVLPFACALELVHTYSLIHDDLPAMDNDDFRRGRPTSHKVFGEGMAILAGDALLTEAFYLMTKKERGERFKAEARLEVIHEIAKAAGFFGMIGGQVVDLQSQGKTVDHDTLYYIHTHKTGAMILASVRAGAILGGADTLCRDCLNEYGKNIGLAFQITDDILDIVGDKDLMGKTTGADENMHKVTYPSTMGIDKAKQQGITLVKDAIAALAPLDQRADPLRKIALYVIERQL